MADQQDTRVEHTLGEATPGSYRRHLADGEEPCDACKAAEAEYKRGRRADLAAQAAESFADALDLEPEIEGEFDQLADLRDTLRMVRAEMRVAKSSRERASLAKVRIELGDKIRLLEAAQGQKANAPHDEIRARRNARRARQAAAAN